MRLHDFIFVADFSEVSVCTTLCTALFFVEDVSVCMTFFCRGFFGLFSLHVLFVANFSDASVCTLLLSRTFRFARFFVADFSDVSFCTFFLLPIFRMLQFARRYFCPLLLPFACDVSHLLQPLDVGVFGPLDRYCSQEVDT